MEKIKMIAVVGATATGKSALGVRLAEYFGGEIVSADSMQIYRDMPIAAAVPPPEERGGIPHHLIEILDPGEKCTVAGYSRMAAAAIDDIAGRGKIPVLVGGTGLYIDAVLKNYRFPEEPGNFAVRAALEAEYDRRSAAAMYAELLSADPETAQRVHPNDKKRVIRALEIYRLTGVTKTESDVNSRLTESPYDCVTIGLRFNDREKLYDRINSRVDGMLSRGLIGEAERWYRRANGCGGAGAAIGHKEFFPYFAGEITYGEAVENLKRATRRYAKRQITWFSAKDYVNWISVDGGDDVFVSAVSAAER